MPESLKTPSARTRRILIVDDNEATHEDFHKILDRRPCALDSMEAALFGDAEPAQETSLFELHGVLQGKDGLEEIRQALQEGRPYDMAFVDLRMPPGWDGIETIKRIWEVDPDLHVVLCAAFLGQSSKEVLQEVGRPERFSILLKPFESAKVLELAEALAG